MAGRETKRIFFKLKQLSRVHSCHTKSRPTPRLNKKEISVTDCMFILEVPLRTKICEMSKKDASENLSLDYLWIIYNAVLKCSSVQFNFTLARTLSFFLFRLCIILAILSLYMMSAWSPGQNVVFVHFCKPGKRSVSTFFVNGIP